MASDQSMMRCSRQRRLQISSNTYWRGVKDKTTHPPAAIAPAALARACLQVSFRMHIIHIDESAALGLTPEQAAAARASVAAAAERYCGEAGVQYHCVPLEAIFAADVNASLTASPANGAAAESAAAAEVAAAAGRRSPAQQQGQQEQQLRALLGAVSDGTGRQDLARHLRTQLLLRTAAGLGCGRVARGDCSTTLAAHIVAAAAKGCGYSLPGDIHLVDARQAAPC
jgi:hypothetical protein